MQHHNKIPYIVAFLLIIMTFIPGRGGTQFLSFGNSSDIVMLSAAPSSVTINETVTLTVTLDTGTTPINAVGIIIDFDPNILSIASVDTSSSFCTLYTDRTYDSKRGYVNLFCGKPNPGFSGQNILETIQFNTIGYGNAPIQVDTKSLVLENDGKGTNILKVFEKKSISVILSQ